MSNFASINGKVLSSGHELRVHSYRHGHRAMIRAWTSQGEVECDITVNLPEERLGEGEFFVRNETREFAPEVFQALIKDGIAEPIDRMVGAGYVEQYAQVWRLKSALDLDETLPVGPAAVDEQT